MNAILLLLIAAMIVLFGAQQTGTDPGMPPVDDDIDEVEVPDDEDDEDVDPGNGEDENGDNGDNGENGDNRDLFTFNIDDSETLDLIYSNHGEEIASFPQDLITLDMTEEDIVAEYGDADNVENVLNYTVHRYGDIGVAYLAEDATVADILYMPTITYEELIEVLGEADQEVLEFEEGDQDDTPYANYLIQENEAGNLYASFKLFEDDNDELNVWFMDKMLLDDGVADEITEEEIDEVVSDLNSYFQGLGAYYRGESDDIFNYVYGEDNELNQLIVANNESGDFVNYEVLSWTIQDIARADDEGNAYEVVVFREYTFGDDSQFEEITMTLDRSESGIIVESIN